MTEEMINYLREKWVRFLYRRIHFDQWHLDSADKRPYAVYLIRRINSMQLTDGTVVELGCGLGDILAGIHAADREGYDIDGKVIRAARMAHPFLKTYTGSFGDIRGRRISLLIAVNFLFTLDEHSFRKNFDRLLRNNEIDRIVVDEVTCPPYQYGHDFVKYFKARGYKTEYRSRGFAASGGRRRLLFFRKDTQ